MNAGEPWTYTGWLARQRAAERDARPAAGSERLVVKAADPAGMTGRVIGASEDGAQLAVLWSDLVTRVEPAASLADYQPAP